MEVSIIFLGNKILRLLYCVLSVNAFDARYELSISVLISRLLLSRNSSFQILRNSFALKF